MTIGRPKKDQPKQTKTFSGYFEPELLDALRKDAESEDRSLNGHIIYICKKYLKEKGVL
jgi:hypothetical protein